jgi:rubrerythrin
MTRFLLSAVICFAGMFGNAAPAAEPEHEAIRQYRAYVKAVRDGKTEEILKLVVPVSKAGQPFLMAKVKREIVLERLRKETEAQMGPKDYKKDDGWFGLGQWPDEVLKDLKVVTQGGDLVALVTKNPETGKDDLAVNAMMRRDGKWLVPLGLYFDDEGGGKFKEAQGEEGKELLEHVEAEIKGAEATLKRLEKKEFKTRDEVSNALTTELSKAGAG